MNEVNVKDNKIEHALQPKVELIIAGIGGGGVLTVGTIMAEAAVDHYANVTWFPSYAISKRGGYCECTVVISKETISSPVLTQANGIIVAEASQYKDFESRVRTGGLMVIEESGLKDKPTRQDIKVIGIPAIQTAIEVSGSSLGAGLVLLGAYLETTRLFPPELVKEQITKAYAAREKIKKANLNCFNAGREIIRQRTAPKA